MALTASTTHPKSPYPTPWAERKTVPTGRTILCDTGAYMRNVPETENLVQRPVLSSEPVTMDMALKLTLHVHRGEELWPGGCCGMGVTSSLLQTHWPQPRAVSGHRLGLAALGRAALRKRLAKSPLCGHTGPLRGRQPDPARGLPKDKQGA